MKKLPKARLIFLLLWVSVRVVFHMAGHDKWASFISVTSATPCSINYDNLYSLALFWAPFLSISSFTSPLSPVLLLSPIFPQLQVSVSFLIFHHLPLCVPARQAGVCTDTHSSSELLQKYLRANGETNGLCRMCVYPPWRIIQRRSFQALC